jgi:hypothetical protein
MGGRGHLERNARQCLGDYQPDRQLRRVRRQHRHRLRTDLLPLGARGGRAVFFLFAYYRQGIRFIGTACNGGGCDPQSSTVWTDFQYTPGRKNCDGSNLTIYGLGSCAC